MTKCITSKSVWRLKMIDKKFFVSVRFVLNYSTIQNTQKQNNRGWHSNTETKMKIYQLYYIFYLLGFQFMHFCIKTKIREKSQN